MFGGPEIDEGVLIPFLDPQLKVRRQTQWSELANWRTKSEDLYVVTHYNVPTLKMENQTLEISGLVRKGKTLTLDDIKKRKRQTVTVTLECGGNGNSASFMGAIGNVQWTGTPLANLIANMLAECSPFERGIEVVFFGADERMKKFGQRLPAEHGRSLHINDVLRDDLLLCYERNGEPLTKEHGFPLRLVVPAWFGISWTKWLTRIEVLDRCYISKYVASEYVTNQSEQRADKTIWRLTSRRPVEREVGPRPR